VNGLVRSRNLGAILRAGRVVTEYTFEIPVRITVQAALMDDSGIGELLGPFTKWLKLRLEDMTVPANTHAP